jgi:predicted RNA-binding Zn ribbon-like protein
MPTSSARPFRYVAGDASLDFVNTVDWTARGLANERIGDFEAMTRWAEGAGTLPRPEAERLRRLAAARPRDARSALERAHALRDALKRVFDGVAAGEARRGAALDELNEKLGAALGKLRLRAGRRGGAAVAEWGFAADEDGFASILWPIEWAAARLLVSDDSRRVRLCAGPDCGWLYVDRSRNGLRRWCEMETCGTIEKSRRRRERVVRGR